MFILFCEKCGAEAKIEAEDEDSIEFCPFCGEKDIETDEI